MCLFPRLLKNPKYQQNKKNGGVIPDMQDIRVRYVPVACGNCIECRKAKAREWQVRLNEELKRTKYAYFITLDFEPTQLKQLCEKYNLKESNAVAGKAVRLFLERVRKDYKKSIKHWLITELGQTNTERIHLHGIFFLDFPINNDWLRKYWRYGERADTGQYCNARTINYIIKYVTKIDTRHKNFKAQIFCSKGLGSNYITEFAKQKHKYKGTDTKDYYTLPNGAKVNLPIYYRNKLFTEEEREKLWCDKLDKDTRYIFGTEIAQASKNQKYLLKVIEKAQETNKAIGYGDHSAEWKKEDYNVTLAMLKKDKTNK